MPLKLVKRSGRDAWYLRGTVAGVSVFESTGTSDREIAEALRIKTESRLEHEAVHGKKSTATFDEAMESYKDTGAPMRFILDVRKTDGHASGLAVYFRGRKLKDIRQEDLDAAAKEMYPGASRETLVRQVYTPFIAIWNHAAKKQWADVRVWERPRKARGTNVTQIRSSRSGTNPVSYDRAASFISVMSPAPAMLMAFLFYTGMRPIEAFALLAEDVNLEKRWLVVRSSKTGEPRGVPIHDFLAEWLPDLVERGGHLFRGPRGEPYAAIQDGGGGLKTAINGARKRSSIKDVSPYTGRHTVSTQLVINGIHPHIKDQILGHAADSMSRHYTHVPQQPLIEAINTLPVPAGLRALPWVSDPKVWWGKLAEGTGKRTDLQKKKA
ncbi:Tyrosine recombinase XerC [Aquamicrobium terrae]